ncbi:OmpA family protein [Robiginitalea sp. IMCC44478]|uniref:OmpA family protein n=1 Tax=Robiginitalea sp. IMCC44478 TaxID=3459122 RepID=UPI0040430A80
MKSANILLSTLCFLIFFKSAAQQEIPELNGKDSIISSSWVLGLGFNFVDDSGDAWGDFTTIKNQWNAVPYPSRLSLGRYFQNGLGVELIGAYNRYTEGNTIDGITIDADIPYWSLDGRLSYDLNKLFGETGLFDPYLGAGLGYTDANNQPRATYNAVFGFRLWFSDRWGLDLNTSGKWSFGNKATNHIQHAAGVVYRFGLKKSLSKKGKIKEALLKEFDSLRQQSADSLRLAETLAEEQRNADRLLAEKQTRDSLLLAEKQETERRNTLQNELSESGTIGFGFDSYRLEAENLKRLARIASLMKRYSDFSFIIIGHTDARGPSGYNQLLSEKRAAAVMNFLLEQGIDQSRLQASGKGETELLNACKDGVSCTVSEHALNRRVDIEIKAIFPD